jgi:Tfp pilus assembly protein PilN
MLRTPPEGGFHTLIEHPGGEVEAYGESEARPLFSAVFDMPVERVRPYAASELRLPVEQPALGVSEILPVPAAVPEGAVVAALPYAAAIAAACPWLALRANLLPMERRTTSSRLIYVPTVVLASTLLLSVAALAIQGAWEDRRYMAALQSEIKKLEPRVRQAAIMDKRTETARSRTALLDSFRRRSRDDMDVLKETTHLLAPPTWLNSIEINRALVNLGGETEQAAQLLKILDASPLFEGSDFTLGITRVGNM